MADKSEVFAEGELACNSREPTSLPNDTPNAANGDGANPRRPRRRPRKVVVYYYDTDNDAEDESAAAAKNAQGQPNSDNSSPRADKLDCPGIAELEAYSNGHASARNHSSGPVAHCCNCCHARKPVSGDNPRIGSPTPIGFFAFGMTTLLYNVHNAKICQLNMATMGLVIMFGGLTQFLCGFFELINMNTLGCTISTTYGAFWMATAVLFLWPENTYVTMGDTTYTGGFFLLWFFFAGTLFASAFRSPFMCMALFFLVPLNFLLQSIGYFADSVMVAKVAGYEGIIVGALATYLGMAFTLRDVYGRSLLPILFQKNMRYVEW